LVFQPISGEADKEDKEDAVDQIVIFGLFHGFIPVRGDEFKADNSPLG
jgi:hypothetical protein